MAEENVEATEPSQEDIQRQATDMGWLPKDQWKGNPNTWVDAGEFVKRGETFIPFLQHDRKKLKGELDAEKQARQRLETELRETRESVEGLKAFNETMAEERKARRKAEIGQELRSAREAGDDVKVAELQNELGEVVKKPAESAAPARSNGGTPPPAQPVIQPWVRDFIDGNADFFKNNRKIALFNAVMIERRQAGDTRVGEVEGTALLNEAREEVERALGANVRRQAPARTEESRSAGGGGRPASSSGYADLPSEARDKCDAQEAKFVGPTKAFKNQAEWRKHYASEYFGPSEVARARTGE